MKTCWDLRHLHHQSPFWKSQVHKWTFVRSRTLNWTHELLAQRGVDLVRLLSNNPSPWQCNKQYMHTVLKQVWDKKRQNERSTVPALLITWLRASATFDPSRTLYRLLCWKSQHPLSSTIFGDTCTPLRYVSTLDFLLWLSSGNINRWRKLQGAWETRSFRSKEDILLVVPCDDLAGLYESKWKRHLRSLPYKLWVQVNGRGRRYSCLVPELVRVAVCLLKLTQDILGFPLYWVSPNKHRTKSFDWYLFSWYPKLSFSIKEKQQSSPL